MAELRKMENLITTLHCSGDGNFEPLQCDTDSGLCYCVDPKSGRLNGAVVPAHEWKGLPCYSVNLTSSWDDKSQYLRRCESERVRNSNNVNVIKNHIGFIIPYFFVRL